MGLYAFSHRRDADTTNDHAQTSEDRHA
jgi:hypothetical protein